MLFEQNNRSHEISLRKYHSKSVGFNTVAFQVHIRFDRVCKWQKVGYSNIIILTINEKYCAVIYWNYTIFTLIACQCFEIECKKYDFHVNKVKYSGLLLLFFNTKPLLGLNKRNSCGDPRWHKVIFHQRLQIFLWHKKHNMPVNNTTRGP